MKIRVMAQRDHVVVWTQPVPYGPVESYTLDGQDRTQDVEPYICPAVSGTALNFDVDRRNAAARRRADTTYNPDVAGRRGPNRGRRSDD
jgi:hypothetical protein